MLCRETSKTHAIIAAFTCYIHSTLVQHLHRKRYRFEFRIQTIPCVILFSADELLPTNSDDDGRSGGGGDSTEKVNLPVVACILLVHSLVGVACLIVVVLF